MDTPSASTDPAFARDLEYQAGEIVFDDYEIHGKVGAGGMGVVYKAKNTALNRMVALKVLPKSISTNAIIRVQNEARALGRLQNDNIASVFDLKIASDGTPYLAMQFIDGPTLDQLLEQKQTLPLKEFLSIFTPICEALAHAHARDVIHRDIKPSNIILENRDGKLVPVIVDFGVAKLENVDGRLTQSGSCLGTPLYASPEQAQTKPISDRSDMYSLGCLMFHCLVGKPRRDGNGHPLHACKGKATTGDAQVQNRSNGRDCASSAALAREGSPEKTWCGSNQQVAERRDDDDGSRT